MLYLLLLHFILTPFDHSILKLVIEIDHYFVPLPTLIAGHIKAVLPTHRGTPIVCVKKIEEHKPYFLCPSRSIV
jgi:hypothetical protein